MIHFNESVNNFEINGSIYTFASPMFYLFMLIVLIVLMTSPESSWMLLLEVSDFADDFQNKIKQVVAFIKVIF